MCALCPHRCALEEGAAGFCRARKNENGTVVCANYGRATSLALDPVEKKPLRRFFPGRMVLSVGSYGCNLRCPFCQNSEISMSDGNLGTVSLSPQVLVEKAAELRPRGNIGIAYTYNEPLVGYEYVRDCAALAKEKGLKNIVVTNGCFCEEPLRDLLPDIDAMNIDLKAFSQRFYGRIGGDLETVKRAIALCSAACHVEVTTLIVPGENDTEEEMRALSSWLAGVDPEIPLHVTRFFPRWKMSDRGPTPAETVYALADAARERLRHVYVGNC